MKLGSTYPRSKHFMRENGAFLCQEYAISLRKHYPHLNPKKTHPPFPARGGECMFAQDFPFFTVMSVGPTAG